MEANERRSNSMNRVWSILEKKKQIYRVNSCFVAISGNAQPRRRSFNFTDSLDC